MWFVFAIAAGLLFAINRLIFRKIAPNSGSALGLVAVHDLLAGLLLVPIWIFTVDIPTGAETWLLILSAGFLLFLTDYYAVKSLEKVEATIYQIVGQLRHFFVLIGAFIVFDESLTALKVFAIFLLFAGVLLAMFEKSKFDFSKGVIFGLWSTVYISIASLIIKELTDRDVPVSMLASLGLILPGLFSWVALKFDTKAIKTVVVNTKELLVVAAVVFAAFEYSFFTSLDLEEASKVVPATQSSLVFTIIGGYLFLNERGRLRNKIVGSALVAIAIGLIYLV